MYHSPQGGALGDTWALRRPALPFFIHWYQSHLEFMSLPFWGQKSEDTGQHSQRLSFQQKVSTGNAQVTARGTSSIKKFLDPSKIPIVF